MHRIVVEGPGLKPETRLVSYDKDFDLKVSLQPAAEPSATASAAPSAKPAAVDTGRRAFGGRTSRPASGIEEKDPYKQ